MAKQTVFTYKSLKIYEDKTGLKEITGLKGRDIISEVIPDAVEYINCACQTGAILKNLNGVDFYVLPNENIDNLIEKWKYEHFRVSGLEF